MFTVLRRGAQAIASPSQGASYYERDGYYAKDDPAHQDEKQLDGVEAGKPFAQLQRAGMQTAAISSRSTARRALIAAFFEVQRMQSPARRSIPSARYPEKLNRPVRFDGGQSIFVTGGLKIPPARSR